MDSMSLCAQRVKRIYIFAKIAIDLETFFLGIVPKEKKPAERFFYKREKYT